MRVRRSRGDSASVLVLACSACNSAHSGSPLAARAASRSSMPARHVSHWTTRRAGLMRPRSQAITTAGVRFSSAAMASCVRPSRWRVAMSCSGDTDEAWPRRRAPATRLAPVGAGGVASHLRTSWHRGLGRWRICLLRGGWPGAYGASSTASSISRLVSRAAPAGEGGHDNGKPGESRGRKALEATAGPGDRTAMLVQPPNGLRGEGLVMRPADGHADQTEPHVPAGPARAAAPPARPPVPPTQASERFAAALRAAAATGATNVGALREAVRAYVGTRRDAGDPPERALIAVKERVGDALRRAAGYAEERCERAAPAGRALGDRSVLSCRLNPPVRHGDLGRRRTRIRLQPTIRQRNSCAVT